jgi:hypothetical protein
MHRWRLDEGGVVGWIDLVDAALLVPGGVIELRCAGTVASGADDERNPNGATQRDD